MLSDQDQQAIIGRNGRATQQGRAYGFAEALAAGNGIILPTFEQLRADPSQFNHSQIDTFYRLGSSLLEAKQSANPRPIATLTDPQQMHFLRYQSQMIEQTNYHREARAQRLEGAGLNLSLAGILLGPYSLLGSFGISAVGGLLVSTADKKLIDGIPLSILEQVSPSCIANYFDEIRQMSLNGEGSRYLIGQYLNQRMESSSNQLAREIQRVQNLLQGDIAQIAAQISGQHAEFRTLGEVVVRNHQKAEALQQQSKKILRQLEGVEAQVDRSFNELSAQQRAMIFAQIVNTNALMEQLGGIAQQMQRQQDQQQWQVKQQLINQAIDNSADVILQIGGLAHSPKVQRVGQMIKLGGGMRQNFVSLLKAIDDPQAGAFALIEPISGLINIGLKLFSLFRRERNQPHPLAPVMQQLQRMEAFLQENFQRLYEQQRQIYQTVTMVFDLLQYMQVRVEFQLGNIQDLLIEAVRELGCQDYRSYLNHATQGITYWQYQHEQGNALNCEKRIKLLAKVDFGLRDWAVMHSASPILNGAKYAEDFESMNRFMAQQQVNPFTSLGFLAQILQGSSFIDPLPAASSLVQLDLWQDAVENYVTFLIQIGMPEDFDEHLYQQILGCLDEMEQAGRQAFEFINRIKSDPAIFEAILLQYRAMLFDLQSRPQDFEHRNTINAFNRLRFILLHLAKQSGKEKLICAIAKHLPLANTLTRTQWMDLPGRTGSINALRDIISSEISLDDRLFINCNHLLELSGLTSQEQLIVRQLALLNAAKTQLNAWKEPIQANDENLQQDVQNYLDPRITGFWRNRERQVVPLPAISEASAAESVTRLVTAHSSQLMCLNFH